MGVMYRKVTDFTSSRQAGVGAGMTEQVRTAVTQADQQSLCHFLHHELSEYHRLLAVLESQLAESLTSDASGLTLLRLGLWTEEIKIKMRLMSEIVDDATCGCICGNANARCTWRRAGIPYPRADATR
jgi:gamma-tubulin complex component 3